MSDNRKAVLPKSCGSLLLHYLCLSGQYLFARTCENFWNIKKIKILKDSRILRLNSCNLPLSKSNTLKYLVEQMFTLLRIPREKKPSTVQGVFLSPALLCCLPGTTQVVPSCLSLREETFLGSKLERVGKFDYFFLKPFPKFNHSGKSRFLIYNVLCAWFLTLPQEYVCRWPQWNSKFLGFSISAVPQPSA